MVIPKIEGEYKGLYIHLEKLESKIKYVKTLRFFDFILNNDISCCFMFNMFHIEWPAVRCLIEFLRLRPTSHNYTAGRPPGNEPTRGIETKLFNPEDRVLWLPLM